MENDEVSAEQRWRRAEKVALDLIPEMKPFPGRLFWRLYAVAALVLTGVGTVLSVLFPLGGTYTPLEHFSHGLTVGGLLLTVAGAVYVLRFHLFRVTRYSVLSGLRKEDRRRVMAQLRGRRELRPRDRFIVLGTAVQLQRTWSILLLTGIGFLMTLLAPLVVPAPGWSQLIPWGTFLALAGVYTVVAIEAHRASRFLRRHGP